MGSRRARSVSFLLIATFLQGCFGHHIRKSNYYKTGFPWEIDARKLPDNLKPTKEWTVNHGLWGLVGHPVVNIRKVCGKKTFQQASVAPGWGQMFVQLITVGLYIPSTVKVFCGKERNKT